MSSSPFINHLRSDMRIRSYSMKTDKAYLYRIRYFIRFHHSTGAPYQCKTKS
ncbi:phage integrase N-terminal SAM-like domain-containing protein [Marinomonas gallaica]|uniref:phage integrase N-terminal SAM-like domain-containing protein n=1 Tax=Marinomonas gallaica TaxID=1806667 RepID=UPI000A898E2E|nr:phage integrase N-terminal SAM-like domain-containing protein [Marinomonas gallaica]